MSWILGLCLLGVGGVFREAQSADGILDINKKLISEDDPLRSFLYEGDIVTLPTSKYDSKRSKWPWVNGTVRIPYTLSDDYDAEQRNVIFEAFKDLENATCIRFVERKNQQDYISIVPGNGCYSSVGRCGQVQVVSLAFECLQRGKGVVLHEFMHAIGFWHEHSRADRDEYVIIHYSEIIKGFWPNFCKFQTSNMIVPYDYDSLLHYSGNAFAKSKAPTIEPRNHSANIGQRVKLSKSDILRINKLYHCPQYVPSEDDKLEVVRDLPSGGVTCTEEYMHDTLSSSATVFTTLMADSVSLEGEQSSSSLPPTESSKTSPDVLYSSNRESMPGPSSSTFSNLESKSQSSMYSHAEETTHQLLDNQGATVGSTITEGSEAKVILHTSTSLLKTANKEATSRLPDHQTSTVISKEGFLVTGLELNSLDSTKFPPATKDSSTFMQGTTNAETGQQLPNNQTYTVAITGGSSVSSSELYLSDITTVATPKEGSVSEAILPTSIFTQKLAIASTNTMEENGLLQTSHSTNSQSGENQQETKAEDKWSSSVSGQRLNVTSEKDQEYVKENLHIVRKRFWAWKTFSIPSERHRRGVHGKELTLSYNNRRKSSENNKPFCGFEHGFCGWKQSTEDDLDWKLGWGSLNVNTGHFRPEGFHLTLKNSSEGSVSGQKALLLRPIVQPSNCISFWYGSRHSAMGTLNVYITSSGREETLLWSSGGQLNVKWTRAQIMLPPHLLSNNAYVVIEGVIGALGTSTIALDDLYVGQCS